MFSSEAKYLAFHFEQAFRLLLGKRTNRILHEKRKRKKIFNATHLQCRTFFNITVMVTVHLSDVKLLKLARVPKHCVSVFETHGVGFF